MLFFLYWNFNFLIFFSLLHEKNPEMLSILFHSPSLPKLPFFYLTRDTWSSSVVLCCHEVKSLPPTPNKHFLNAFFFFEKNVHNSKTNRHFFMDYWRGWISIHPKEVKWKQTWVLFNCGQIDMDWEIRWTIFINFCLWSRVTRLRLRILGPTLFVAFKNRKKKKTKTTKKQNQKNLGIFHQPDFFSFVSKKAQLNARFLTQCDNQKFRKPRLPRMMSQNP